MILEQRTYVLHTGASLTEYLEAYESIGLPVQRRILEGFVGYFITEFGTQNELNHYWAYSDLEDRRERRACLSQDEDWQRCLSIIRPMIMTMQNKIMYPTSFSPIRSIPINGRGNGTAFGPNKQEPNAQQGGERGSA